MIKTAILREVKPVKPLMGVGYFNGYPTLAILEVSSNKMYFTADLFEFASHVEDDQW